jgi:hypothetical protein
VISTDMRLRELSPLATTTSAALSPNPAVVEYAATRVLQLPPAPNLARERERIDPDDLYGLMQLASSTHAHTLRNRAAVATHERTKLAEQQKQKANEALEATKSKGFWDSVCSFFSWVGKSIGLALGAVAGILTGGIAAVAAGCAMAYFALSETGLLEKLGTFGRWLGSALQIGAGLGHIASIASKVLDQAFERLGLYDEMGKWSQALRAGLSVAAVVGSAAWKGGALASPGPQGVDLAKRVVSGITLTGEGVGRIGSAVAERDATRARLASDRLRLEGDKLRRLILDLIERVEEENERAGRIARARGGAQEVRQDLRARIGS